MRRASAHSASPRFALRQCRAGGTGLSRRHAFQWQSQCAAEANGLLLEHPRRNVLLRREKQDASQLHNHEREAKSPGVSAVQGAGYAATSRE